MKKIFVLLGLMLAVTMTATAQTATEEYERNRKYDILFLEAMMHRQKGESAEAFDLLTRCVELKPEASEAYFFLAQHYTEMRDNERAIKYLQRAVEISPNNTTYLEMLAQVLFNNKRFEEAATAVEKIYEGDKSRQDLLEMLYQLYLQQREYDKAVGVLDRMETIDGKSERLSLAKSSLYLQTGRRQEAIEEVRSLTQQHPSDLNYRTLYANTLIMDGQNEEAVAILKDILREEPTNYRAQMTLRTYYNNNDMADKADSLTRSMLLNSTSTTEDKISLMRDMIGRNEQSGGDSTVILNMFADMLSESEPDADILEFSAAYMIMKKMPRKDIEERLRKALATAPDRASARLQLVQYAWEDGNNDEVVSLCSAARQYNPDEMAFYYYQGMAFFRKDDTDNALSAFQNGISVIDEDSDPAIVSDFYAIMGDLLQQKGKMAEAFEAYDSCLQWKSDNIGCLNNYAYFLSLENRDLEKAEKMSFQTIKAEPRNSTYLDTYAWILFQQQRYGEARVYIEQALANDSTMGAVVLEHAGDIFALDGDIDKAVEYWQRALKDEPKNKILRKKIKKRNYIKNK